jgi:type I restriction enzyme S subunit
MAIGWALARPGRGGHEVSAVETATKDGLQGRFKPYPAYKDSGVEWLGEIPEHWRESKVKYLGNYINGYPFKPEDWSSDGLPIIRIQNLTNPDASFNRFVGDAGLRRRVKNGDILISWSASLGLYIWNGEEDGWLNQHIFKVALREDVVDRRFFIWLGDWFIRELQKEAHGSTMTHLTNSMFGGFRVELPPFDEQLNIATFLDRETARIDALVAKKQRLIELLKEQRAALITRAVTMGLATSLDSPQAGTEIFPSIPSGWEISKLRRILSQKKRPVEVQQDLSYQEIGVRSWGCGIFHKDPLNGALLEEKSVYRIEPGDFVLNIVFAWEGAVAIASEHERGMVGSHRFPTFLVSEEVDPEYLLMVLQIEQGRWLMQVNSPGAAGRNKTIRLNQFLDEEIPLPPLSIQRELVCRVREQEKRLAALKGRLEEAINRLKDLRIALIFAAVTGKIDVREELL